MGRFNNLEFGDQFEDQPVTGGHKDGSFYLTEARGAFKRGRFEEALRAYAKVLEFDSGSAECWTGQVQMLIELGEFKEAKLWADKALETFPADGDLLAAKAVALARLGDTDAALSFSDAAVEVKGTTPYVWLARADVLLARAEKRAEFCVEKALSLAGADWVICWLACRMYHFYRKFSRALKMAQQALALDATQAVLWLQYGRCQMALGLAEAATNSFEHARELDECCRPDAEAFAELSDASLWHRLRGWCRQVFSK